MNRQILVAGLLAVLLAGCGSGVKLDEVPVEDKSGQKVVPPSPVTSGANTGAATQSNVAAVDLSGVAQPGVGPVGVARIVYFDYDSFVIKPEFQALIEAHSRFLKANAARKVVLEGHTDERGGREYNLALGQKRSEAVRRALGLLGVPDSQVEAVSFGKEKQAMAGTTEAAMAQNRRAEISYR